jgi:hypothetical protein
MAQGDRIIGYARRNRRRDKRRAMACRLVAGTGRLQATTKDISLGGFAAPGPLPGLGAGSIIPVELEAPGGRWIAVDAMVVRNADDFAAAFQGLTPQAFRDIERLMASPMRALDRSHRLAATSAGA